MDSCADPVICWKSGVRKGPEPTEGHVVKGSAA